MPRRNKAIFGQLLFAAGFLITPLSAIAETHEVQVLNSFFSPNNLTIEVGDTVRWINASGGPQHDVTADDGSFASITASSFTFERTFNSIAEILYHCTVHSRAASAGGTSMNGSVQVVAAGAQTEVSVESLEVIGTGFEAGANFRLKATLKNTSSDDSGMFNLNVYASVDADITTDDTLLKAISISNIAAGASNNLDEIVDLPTDLVAGDYFIGVISDLDDADSSNNTLVNEVSVYVFTEFAMNAGLNDAWFNPITDGQGFFITIFPDLELVFLAWFTFDTELPPEDAMANLGDPGHRWITAIGDIVGNQSELAVYVTSEGLFDTPPPEEGLPVVQDGTIILSFKNCNEGTVSYDLTSINAVGAVPIQRIALDSVPLCNSLLRASQQDPQQD